MVSPFFITPAIVAVLLIFAPGKSAAGEEGSYFLHELEKGYSQKIVAYGTSLTASSRWPAGLQVELRERYGRKTKVVNAAGNGMDSRWGLAHLGERVLKEKPSAVLIEFAINDALAHSKLYPAESARNLTRMIRMIRSDYPQCEIILMIMNPPTGPALEKRPQIRQYEAVYRDVAKRENCQLIDFSKVWRRMISREPALWKHYAPDGLHPTPAAAEEVILPDLLRKIGLSSDSTRGHKVS